MTDQILGVSNERSDLDVDPIEALSDQFLDLMLKYAVITHIHKITTEIWEAFRKSEVENRERGDSDNRAKQKKREALERIISEERNKDEISDLDSKEDPLDILSKNNLQQNILSSNRV